MSTIGKDLKSRDFINRDFVVGKDHIEGDSVAGSAQTVENRISFSDVPNNEIHEIVRELDSIVYGGRKNQYRGLIVVIEELSSRLQSLEKRVNELAFIIEKERKVLDRPDTLYRITTTVLLFVISIIVAYIVYSVSF